MKGCLAGKEKGNMVGNERVDGRVGKKGRVKEKQKKKNM